jgi:hypothetical protein
MTSEASTALEFYEDGDIERRLGLVLQGSTPQPESDLQPWRSAAAVLVRFDPASLKPVGATFEEARGLSLLPELVAATGPDSQAQWTLPTKARKAELQQLATQENIAAALAANPQHPADAMQQVFDEAISGKALPPLVALTREQLSALLIVIDWLEGIPILPRLPAISDMRSTLETRQDLDRLERLAGGFFTGRTEELAKLHAHLFGADRSILFISGTGGTGKSALLAKSLLALCQETKDPTCWVRFDIADATVNPAAPVTLLTQAAQQLHRRDPSLERVVSAFTGAAESRRRSLDYSGLESISNSSTPEAEVAWAIDEFKNIIRRYQASGRGAERLRLLRRFVRGVPRRVSRRSGSGDVSVARRSAFLPGYCLRQDSAAGQFCLHAAATKRRSECQFASRTVAAG